MEKRNRDAVIQELVTVAGALLTAYLIRKVAAPDFPVVLRMKTALVVKRVADAQAAAWQKVASDAATAYQKARL